MIGGRGHAAQCALGRIVAETDATVVEEARAHAGDLYVFRGLVKILWHDGLGMSLYAKRLAVHPATLMWRTT
jgi:hypothetical protein